MVRRPLLALGLAVLVLLVAAVAFDLVVFRERVHHGVTVWGEQAGGLTKAQLEERLGAKSDRVLATALDLRGGEEAATLRPADAGFTVDVARMVDEAYALGRTGGWWRQTTAPLRLWFAHENVAAVVAVDPSQWRQAADLVALSFERLPVDAALVLQKQGPAALPGSEGIALDEPTLQSRILEALQTGASVVRVPLRTLPPRVTSAQAEGALAAARQAFVSPVRLAYQGRQFTLTAKQLLSIAAIDPTGLELGRPLTYDTQAAHDTLTRLLAPIVVPARDAQVLPGPTGKSYSVVPGQDGTAIDWDRLFAALSRVGVDSGSRYIAVPTMVAQPRLTTSDALDLRSTHEVASFTTFFASTNVARAHNIQQVAALLDGAVVRPGQTFSFNGTVGPRTKASGFDEAPVIANGVLTPGIGGGICQVSTTLFNAVFLAGLPVVERTPHSFFIDHYPIGRDATVSYGETDFKFRNDTDHVVIIAAQATDHSVRISLASAAWDRTVTFETSPFRDLRAPQSSAGHPRRLRDPSLAPGSPPVLEAGIEGRTVTVRRTVRGAGQKVQFSDSFVSVYAPKDYILRVP